MAEIDTYSPRKVTASNRDRLPSDHDPKKRITYVNITLNEEEIAEAIRNWIRAQVPVGDVEMPVEMVAGRGTNGHSANVTVPMGPISVTSPTQPTEPMQEFTAAADDARRRNQEAGVDAQPATNTPEDTPAEDVSEDPGIETETTAPEEAETAPAEEATKEPVEAAEPPKKSSLFDGPKSEPLPAPDAAAAAAPPETAKAPEETPEPASETAPKVKSIFDA
jgi:hypothetical protein